MTTFGRILPPRERAALHDAWLTERLDTVVPAIMDRAGLDAWVLVAREYNEDPVVTKMLPAIWMSARRRTILVFLDSGRRRLAVARHRVGDVFESAWDPSGEPDQWAALASILAEANPRRIGLDVSTTFALADGLSSSERSQLVAALPGSLRDRTVDATAAAIGWLETRIPAEMEWYPRVCRIAHDVLREGLSDRVVTPGTTTTADLEWWYRDRVAGLGLICWFHPTASVQRRGGTAPASFAVAPGPTVIEAGDLVHVDFGIEYLGLHTDMQEHAYVLRPGETGVPDGLTAGLRTANRLQDLLIAEFAAGRSGNDVLHRALLAAADDGITASIYTHPLGLHGHAAGPTIGMWDHQDGVPGAGDYPLHPDTVYSIELSARVAVPEWDDQEVTFMLEQDAFFDGERVGFLDGRQTEIWTIG